MYEDQTRLENLILEEIEKTQNREVLFLFSYRNNLLEKVIENTSAKITLVATDSEIKNNERIDKWAENPFKFIELAKETRTRYDFILILNPEEYFNDKEDLNFDELHKEFIRELQRYLLKESGLLILSTHKKGFKLDEYIKPGADKLTKKILTEEERETSSLQAYAFYA